jgi:hypothetical protein
MVSGLLELNSLNDERTVHLSHPVDDNVNLVDARAGEGGTLSPRTHQSLHLTKDGATQPSDRWFIVRYYIRNGERANNDSIYLHTDNSGNTDLHILW